MPVRSSKGSLADSLFSQSALRRVQPDLVLKLFCAYPDWMRWISDNPWAIDQNQIQQFVPYAMENGIRSLWLGEVSSRELDTQAPTDAPNVLARKLTNLHRMLLDLVAAMAIAADTRKVRIYGAEAQSSWALAMRGRYPKFIGSEYLPENPKSLFPIQHQNLSNLSYPSGSFDLAITIEVLEHVPDMRLALSELARVLAPSGVLLSTFPFLYFSEESQIKARLIDNEIQHLVPNPEYHLDPHRKDGALVFELPAWDMLAQCRGCGFAQAEFVLYSTKIGCIAGPHLAGLWTLVCQMPAEK